MGNPYYKAAPGAAALALVEEIAEKHGTSIAEIRGGSRVRNIAHARQEAMYTLAMTQKYSYMAIGLFLGRSDHRATTYGVMAHRARAIRAGNPAIAAAPVGWFNVKPVARDLQEELLAQWREMAA